MTCVLTEDIWDTAQRTAQVGASAVVGKMELISAETIECRHSPLSCMGGDNLRMYSSKDIQNC